MEFVIIASKYLTGADLDYVFVDNVVRGFADQGVSCSVISPQSLYSFLVRPWKRRKFFESRTTDAGNTYKIYSPLFMVYPRKRILGLHLADHSKHSYYRAIKRTYRRKGIQADRVYSHFFEAGFAAVRLGKKLGIPSYIASGEADTEYAVRGISRKMIRKTLQDVTGIVAVSSKNREEIRELSSGDEIIVNKVSVIPNAIDNNRFFQKDRAECREKLGLPKDAFIVSFVGAYIERKGVLRLAEALNRIGTAHSLFIGKGPQEPQAVNMLHSGNVKNEDLCDYLNASDVFVLPTLAEGCSNAIVEALACGLPVISANLPFNDDILNEENSIRLDPMDIDAIQAAIVRLQEDPVLRSRLSKGSLAMAQELTIDNRVIRILNFMNANPKAGRS